MDTHTLSHSSMSDGSGILLLSTKELLGGVLTAQQSIASRDGHCQLPAAEIGGAQRVRADPPHLMGVNVS